MHICKCFSDSNIKHKKKKLSEDDITPGRCEGWKSTGGVRVEEQLTPYLYPACRS